MVGPLASYFESYTKAGNTLLRGKLVLRKKIINMEKKNGKKASLDAGKTMLFICFEVYSEW